jgi:hypothetical protein
MSGFIAHIQQLSISAMSDKCNSHLILLGRSASFLGFIEYPPARFSLGPIMLFGPSGVHVDYGLNPG